MNYLEFKEVYKKTNNLSVRVSPCVSVFIQLQRLFDKNLSLVYLNNSFEDTIWYKKLLNSFINLVDEENTCVDRINRTLEIYKSLYVNCEKINKEASVNEIGSNYRYKNKIA